MWEVWFTLGVLVAVLVTLVLELTSADVAFLAGLALVVTVGIVPVEQALGGFANPTLLALGSLYVVAAAMRETGALARVASALLGSARSLRWALARLIIPVSAGSAFMNNTPIVAMGIPAVRTWARQSGISASKLLLPLSYAAVFGGMCTLMGTSTNLVAHGLLQSNGMAGLGFFELAWIGVPCTIAGWVYLIVAGPWLVRAPDEELESADATETTEPHSVVVREDSRLAGKQLSDARFRERFSAEVQEIRRGGETVKVDDVDDVVLRRGDTLLLETSEGFRKTFEDSPDFYVTSEYTDQEDEEAGQQTARESVETYAVLLVMIAIIGLTAFSVLNIAVSAALGATGLVLARVISPADAREAIDWQVLIVIGAALGLGEAMAASGAAELIGETIVSVGRSLGSLGLLGAVVIGTVILTELITNNGAVALFFPIALSVAAAEGLDPRPLIIGITAAGSMSLVTPFGYQTNLMVYSAGDYRFSDFPRAGAPLHLIFIALVVLIVPLVWPF